MAGLFGGGSSTSTSDKVLNSVSLQQSSYGLAVPLLFGKNRVNGNLIGYDDLKSIPHTTTQSSGGKGGGGSSSSHTTYTYTVSVMIALGEGEIQGINRVWRGTSVTSLSDLGMDLYRGTNNQDAWTYLQTYHPEKAIPYRGVAYVACSALALGDQTAMPNFSFECRGIGSNPSFKDDAIITDVIIPMLTNPVFGAGMTSLGDLTQLRNYTIANGIFISPTIDTQMECQEFITDLAMITNSQPVWSQGVLNLVPYSMETITGNGITYSSSTDPQYTLTEDDFITEDGGEPITMTRSDTADAYNYQTVEFRDRANEYNVDTEYADDQANIELLGLRTADVVTAHAICERSVAKIVAQNILNRRLYTRNIYTITLSMKYCLLDPMDLVSLVNEYLGLDNTLCRVVSIEDSEEMDLVFTIEEAYGSTTGVTLNPSQSAERPTVQYNIKPGDINPPIIFEAPDTLTANGLEVWVGGSGGKNWGGASVWISDTGESFKRIGMIGNPSKQGLLSSGLPTSAGDPDTINTLSVDLNMSRGDLLPSTHQDADNYNTLCYVGGEYLSYGNTTLTGVNKYDLSYLRRGLYNSPITAHLAESQFVKIDNSLFKYHFSQDQIGRKIYLKFTSFNVFGSSEQGLDEAHIYTYTIMGTALISPLPPVTNIYSYYENGNMYLAWSPVVDFRNPLEYEIRKGSVWGSAEVLGRTFNTKFQVQGNGTYWVSAAYQNVYSLVPTEVLVTGARYVQNVIATFSENETFWKGIVSGSAAVVNNTIRLMGSADFDAIPNLDAVWDLDYEGFKPSTGIYQIPESHIVDIVEPALCNISVNYLFYGDSIYQDFDSVENVDLLESWDGEYSQYVGVRIQISINDGEWNDFSVGEYYGHKFNFRIILNNTSMDVTAVLSKFSFSIDVPDIMESKNVQIAATGTSIIYTSHFHAIPEPQITIFNAQKGDELFLTYQGINGFTLQIKNNSIGVDRNINYMVQKY